jgi:O-antigen ligase
VVAGWIAGLVVGFVPALTALLVLSLAACVAGLRRPALGFLAVAAVCTMDSIGAGVVFTGGLWRFNTFNYWLVLVLLVFRTPLLQLRDMHSVTLKALIVLTTVQLVITPDINSGVQEVMEFAVVFAMVAYVARAANEPDIWFWLGLTCGCTGAGAGAVFYRQLSLDMVNANYWAFCPLTGMFGVCLGFRSALGDLRRQLVLLGLALVNFGWVVLSGSRGTLLVGVCCLVFLIVELRSLTRQVVAVCVGALAAATFISLFPDLVDNSVHRVEFLLRDGGSARNRTSGRSDLVAGGLEMFAKHPLGIGTGGFSSMWATLNSVEGRRDFHRVGLRVVAHSGWIRILVENGVLGGLLLAAYASSFAVAGWRQRRAKLLPLGVLVSISFATALLSFEPNQKGLWFLSAAATVLLNPESVGAAVRNRCSWSSRHVARPWLAHVRQHA